MVCTIHQPSIDIFEAFDELLLMKRGGYVTYFGPLGERSDQMVQYFEVGPLLHNSPPVNTISNSISLPPSPLLDHSPLLSRASSAIVLSEETGTLRQTLR